MNRTAAAPVQARPPRPSHVPLALVGPTASGKSDAGVELARRLGAEIVVVDSMTVYRGMDLGTAKPAAALRASVPHHLVDVADPAEPFSVARFQQLARAVLEDLQDRSVPPLLVGGSGLYFRAVVDRLEFPGTEPRVRRWLEAEAAALGPAAIHGRLRTLDPQAAARIEPSNARRSVRALEVAALTGRPFSSYAEAWDRYPSERVRAVGVELPTDALGARIEARTTEMVERGFVQEVEALLDRGFGSFLTSSQAIGYLEATLHLRGVMSAREMMAAMVRRTRNLARRQMAWFRRDPRIHWCRAGRGGAGEIVDEIEERLRG